MKRVEMYGDQRDIINMLADKAKAGAIFTIPAGLERTLRGIVIEYDKAEYETGSVKTSNDYDRGYADGYAQGDKDCLQSWLRSSRQA